MSTQSGEDHCVLDGMPRPDGFTDEQIETLRALAEAIMSHLNLRRASAKLAVRERRFRTIVDAIPQKIWTARPDGVSDFFNQRWYEFTGTAPGESDGMRWVELVHPDDRAPTLARWQECLDKGAEFEAEYRLRHHSGLYRWVLGRARPVRDRRGRIERWFGTSTDIHRTKAAEQAVTQNEERYRALIQAGTSGVWLAAPDGAIAGGWNWDEFTDKAPDEFLGDNWLSTLHPEDQPKAARAWQSALASTTVYETEFRVQRTTGEYCWIFVRAVPLKNPDGSVREWIGTASDIDDHKQAEIRLQASEERPRLAIETTSLGIWDADLRTGHRDWTPVAKAILGLPADIRITRESALERLHPERTTGGSPSTAASNLIRSNGLRNSRWRTPGCAERSRISPWRSSFSRRLPRETTEPHPPARRRGACDRQVRRLGATGLPGLRPASLHPTQDPQAARRRGGFDGRHHRSGDRYGRYGYRRITALAGRRRARE